MVAKRLRPRQRRQQQREDWAGSGGGAGGARVSGGGAAGAGADAEHGLRSESSYPSLSIRVVRSEPNSWVLIVNMLAHIEHACTSISRVENNSTSSDSTPRQVLLSRPTPRSAAALKSPFQS